MVNPGNSKRVSKPPVVGAGVRNILQNLKGDFSSAADGLSNIWKRPIAGNNSKRLKPK